MTCNNTALLFNRPLGLFYMFHGSIYIIPYILCIRVMHYPSMFAHSCYKIMIAMGYVDLAAVFVACILSGFMSYIGLPFCPHTFYIGKVCGALGICFWMTYCALCVVLAFNRYMELKGNAAHYFNGRKTWYWVLASSIYGGIFLAFNLSPWGGMIYEAQSGQFLVAGQLSLIAPVLNNFTIPFVIIGIYIKIVIIQCELRSINQDQPDHQADECVRRVMLTSILICSFTCTCSMSYLIAPPLADKYPMLTTMAQVLWQATHGLNSLIYLTLNKSVRQAVKQLLTGVSSVQPAPTKTKTNTHHPQDVDCHSL